MVFQNCEPLSSNPRSIPNRQNPRTAYRPRVRGNNDDKNQI